MSGFWSELAAVSLMAGQAVLAQPAAAPSSSGSTVQMSNQPPTAAAVQQAGAAIEVVAELQNTPGNIAVAPNGRIFVSMHPFGEPTGSRVWEVDRATKTAKPIEQEWAGPVNPLTGNGISAIIGIRAAQDGTLWVLDAGQPAEALKPESAGGNFRLAPKLFAIDSDSLAPRDAYPLPPDAFKASSFIQDLAIDAKRKKIYLADCGIGEGFANPTPAMIVLDLTTRSARRVLDSDPALMPEYDAKMIVEGTEVLSKNADGSTIAPRVGLNPITISVDNETVYFGSMHGRTLWKVAAQSLASESIGSKTLATRLEKHGPKGVSDGITIDSAGNIYVTDVNNNAIGVLDTAGHYRLFIQDPRLRWADGMSAGPDGWIYVVVNQLHKHAALNAGKAENAPPYLIVRFKPLAPGVVGR